MLLLPVDYKQQINRRTPDVSSDLMKNNFDTVAGVVIFKCNQMVHRTSKSKVIKLHSRKFLILVLINLVLIESKRTLTSAVHETFLTLILRAKSEFNPDKSRWTE